MKKPLEDILDICLEKMKQGASIEDVVKHHPEQAEELKNLLVTAADIKKANSPIPRKKAVAACLKKVRTEAAREKAGLSQKNPPFRFLFFSPAWVKAAAVFLIVVLLPWGTVNLSAESLPGDILYPVKMITEKVRYICCMTAHGKVKLRLQYSEERMKELYRFSSEKRQLDKNLLKSMLDEAGFALDQMNRIAEQDRDIYFSKLEDLSAHQKDILKNLRTIIPSHQKEELEEAIKVCHCRTERMSQMRKNEVPQCQWGPGCCME